MKLMFNRKALLSLVLTVALVAASIGILTHIYTANAEGEKVLDLSQYDVLTLSDNKIESKTYTKDDGEIIIGAVASRKTLNAVAYSFYLNTTDEIDLYLGGGKDNEFKRGFVYSFKNGAVYITREGELGTAGNSGYKASKETTITTDKAVFNKEMKVLITVDYFAYTGTTINDVKTSVWINDEYIGEHVFQNLSKLKPNKVADRNIYTGVQLHNKNKTDFTVRRLSLREIETLYNVRTLTQFGISSGTYTAAHTSRKDMLSSDGHETFDGSVLSMNIKMTGDCEIRYAGTRTDSLSGIRFYTWNGQPRLGFVNNSGAEFSSADFTKLAYSTEHIVTKLLNAGADVKIFSRVMDADLDGDADDVKLAIGISDGKDSYYESSVVYNGKSHFGNNILRFCEFKNNGQIVVTEAEAEDKTPEELGYKKTTVADYNLKGGEYAVQAAPVYGYFTKGASPSGTYLDFDYTAEPSANHDNALNIAGSNSAGWWGIRFYKTSEGYTLFSTNKANYSNSYVIRYEALGITDKSAKNNIKVGVKKVDNDVTVDIWVDGKRVPTVTFGGAAAHFGGYLSICTASKTAVVDSKPEDITLDSLGFTEVQLYKDFQLPDSTYKTEENGKTLFIEAPLKAKTTLDKTYLNVDLKISGEYTGSFKWYEGEAEKSELLSEGGIRYAGEAATWSGLKINTVKGALTITNVLDSRNFISIDSEYAGVDFSDIFNLKLATEMSDFNGDGYDDITAYVFTNDKYMGKYYFFSLNKSGAQNGGYGTTTRIYLRNEEQALEISTPEKAVKPDETLTDGYNVITFESFGIKNNTYSPEKTNTSLVSGAYPFSMNNSLFTGYVKFSDLDVASGAVSQINFGGKTSAWHGLKFWTKKDVLYMQDTRGMTISYQFLPQIAGVNFDEEFLLNVSFQYVDCDNDGTKDDVRVGIWFDGKLYANSYIDLVDYKQHFGKLIGIYTAEGKELSVKSVDGIYKGVDFSVFGFSKNWKKEIFG